jgi:hypothetical protein
VRRRSALSACALVSALLAASTPASAVDLGKADAKPIQLDVTETTIVAQHFDPRTGVIPGPCNTAATPYPSTLGGCASPPSPATVENAGWGDWINRVNAALRWDRWTAGLRLDSAVYWRRPADDSGYQQYAQTSPQQVIQQDNETRFRNSIYPAKLWLTYASPGLEVTAGDSYVQFGRGLTLSMRKIDELGIDTTLRGGKVQIARDPFALTAVAGFANPSRVDEATGRSLFVASNLVNGDPRVPVFGSDRVVGLDLQAGRGLPVTLATHFTRFTRCAPYHYAGAGIAPDAALADPASDSFNPGTCDTTDTNTWLASLNGVPRGLTAHDITMGGQSLEIPDLWGHGKLYVEAVVQQRDGEVKAGPAPQNGNALYAALSVDAGITATTLELKSNRNFYTVAAAVGPQAPEFAIVAYSFLPPAESFNMLDAEGTGDFNACVEGGRLREDVSPTKNLMLYGQGVVAYSQTEQPSGACDAYGHTIAPVAANQVQDKVYDGVGGLEYYFDDKLSHAFVSVGARDDTREDGVFQYREHHVEYSIAKYLTGPWSVEVQGRHRHRKEQGFNQDPTTYDYGWWWEGENYVAVRMAPKWVFTQGFEYTTLIGQPLLYFNGAVLYKFTSSSNVRVFVGEQRGAFRCASGICRFFPAFEGARAELTLRF